MKFLLRVCCLILVVIGGVLVAPYFVNWNRLYGSYVFEQLGAVTKDSGVAIGAIGDITGRFLTPKLTVNNLYMECDEDIHSCVGSVSIEELEFQLSLSTFIFGKPKINSVNIRGLRTDMNSLGNIVRLQTSSGISKIQIFDSVIVARGVVGSSLRNAIRIYSGEIKSHGSALVSQAELKIGDNKYKLSARLDDKRTDAAANVELVSNNAILQLVGKHAKSADGASGDYHWDLSIKSGHLAEFAHAIALVTDTSVLDHVTSQEAIELVASIDTKRDGSFEISNLSINGSGVVGNAAVKCSTLKSCKGKLDLRLVDLDAIFRGSAQGSIERYQVPFKSDGHISRIAADFNASIDIDIKEIRYRDNTARNLVASTSVRDGKIAIDKLWLDLPGVGNSLYISGVTGNRDADGVTRFFGSLKAVGEDIDALYYWLLPMQANMGFSKGQGAYFVLESGLYIAPRVFALQDIRMNSGRATMAGNLKYKSDKDGGFISGDVAITGFDADAYSFQDIGDIQNDIMGFEWLRNSDIAMRVSVQLRDFSIASKMVKELSFLVDVAKRKLSVEKIRFTTQGQGKVDNVSDIRGAVKVTLSSQSAKPKISLNLASDQYGADLFWMPELLEDNGAASVGGKQGKGDMSRVVWSNKHIDLSSFEAIEGDAVIRIKKLDVGGRKLSNFVLKSTLKEGVMTLEKLHFQHGEGQVHINGNVGMGEISSMSVVVSATNFAIDNTNAGKFSGNISVSGSLQTQGKSILEWANSVKGKLKFAVRGLTVKGVDFDGFITDLFETENKSEIAALTRVYLYRGSTIFEKFDGEANIDRGNVISSIQFMLRSAAGGASVSFFIPQFTLTSLCRFSFIPPGSDTPTSIDMTMQGDIWQPNPSFNIDSLFDIVRKGW